MRLDSGNCGEVLIVFQILRVFVGEREAIAGELDGGSNYFFERQLAVFLFRVDEAGHGAGDADGLVSDDAGVFAGSGMTLPWASRYMFSVAAAGAFSRKSMK